MIRLTFVTGSAVRKAIIQGRIITLISAETAYKPVTINLDEIDSHADKLTKIKMSDEDIKLIKELATLGTEEQIARDIIKDFQQTGWRLISKQ